MTHNCSPADNALDYLAIGLEAAQTELALAEIALIEATARAEQAREAHARHTAASAALSGETPVGPPAQYETQGKNAERPDHKPRAADESIITYLDRTETQTPERAAAAELTPEEFDAQRKKKQKARRQEEIDANPYGTLKCPGCGKTGLLVENTLTTAGGGIVRMLVCGGCKNQQMM